MKKKTTYKFVYELPTGIYKGINRNPETLGEFEKCTDKIPFFDSTCFTCFNVEAGAWDLITRADYYQMQGALHEIVKHDNRVIDRVDMNTGLIKMHLDSVSNYVDLRSSTIEKNISHFEHNFNLDKENQRKYFDYSFDNLKNYIDLKNEHTKNNIDSRNVIIRNLIEMRDTQFQMMFSNLMNRLDYHHRPWYRKLWDLIF